MSKTWVYADPHFYHTGVTRFFREDGSPLRPWNDADLMSAEMIQWYNDLVSPEDRVYLLGDIAMNRRALDRSVPLLNGRKVLVKGNHDVDKLSYYAQHFDDIRAVVAKHGFIMSHIPIHPGSLSRWKINIHGHLHANQVMETNTHPKRPQPDPRYVCVSVEHTNYRPILLDEVLHKAGLK